MFVPETETLATATQTEVKNSFEQVHFIPLDQIDASSRLRPVDPVIAQAIAASMAREGLLQPIDVCQLPGRSNYTLVAGGHRLEGAHINRWNGISCFIRSANALDRKAREIAENIFKANLSPLDRAAFVAELYAIEKMRLGMPVEGDGRAFSAGVRWQKSLKTEASHTKDTMSSAYSLREEVAERLGFDVRTIARDLLLHKRLSPSLVERVRKLPIASNATALRQLASMEPSDQNQAVTLMEAGRAKGIAEATAIMTKRVAPDPTKKRLGTFVSTFGRMGTTERKAALREIADMLPKGCVLAFDGPAPAKPLSAADQKQHSEIMTFVRSSAPVADERPDNVVDIEDIIAGAAE